MNGRERVLAFLRGEPVDRLPLMPITMMFAGDYIGVKYGKYATDHRVMVEGQIRVAEAFDFDHVSVISDPAREPADLGSAVRFFDNQPPAIDEQRALLADKARLLTLTIPDLTRGRIADRIAGVALFKERLGGEKLIEGWVEGPCAEAADLRGINTLMVDFYDAPQFVCDLFEFCVEMESQFAQAQIEAGADIIGVGDAAASLIGPRFYNELVWPCEKRLVDRIHAMGAMVRLHICGNTRFALEGMGQLGCEIVDLDYLSPMGMGREIMWSMLVLLCKVEPVKVLRNATPERVAAAVAECHRQAGARFIVGAGCEVCRDTPRDNLRAMVDYARTHKPEDI
ncbi:MAG: uroporphyrinogen decarboxylase family protein [Candidatus Sumerlaeota bacterium]|nr:uroporphyrinogen decarboxylase family protein [Candidatus Sumerlaeota bacterium]